MNLTAKSRYGLKIMLDLAIHAEAGLQKRQEIAKRQNISIDFMDQIVFRLKEAGLIAALRGPSGGIRLKKMPQDITAWEVFNAVEDSLYTVRCLEDHDCQLAKTCSTFKAWDEVYSRIKLSLTEINLYKLVAQSKDDLEMVAMSAKTKAFECKAPNRK